MAKSRRFDIRLQADHPLYPRPTLFKVRAKSRKRAVAKAVVVANSEISWKLVSTKKKGR